MTEDHHTHRQEVVIVRRRGGDDGAGGKGGAWKIAYADFVTAMMAFFLVMWLINASNEETRAQVASYFNPIKLTDSSTGKRGIRDNKGNGPAQPEDAGMEAGGAPPSPSDVRHEAAVMANPDRLLAEIEGKALETKAEPSGAARKTLVKIDPQLTEPLADGIGDPFDPQVEARDEQGSEPRAALQRTDEKPVDPAHEPAIPTNVRSGEAVSPGDVDATPASQDSSESTVPRREPEATPVHETQTPASTATEHRQSVAGNPPSALPQADPTPPASLAQEIQKEIETRLAVGHTPLPASVEVKSIDAGTLISLTDKQAYGMFKTGSAEPEPEMVRLVETIAGVLKSRPGFIVIRGHTDSRPYRNKKYDNWQLSTARAHLAQYMLLRGGLDGSRLRRIEGVADREPRIPEDPEAPENRRIEILLETDDP